MSNVLPQVVIRPFRFEDIATITTLRNVYFQDNPAPVEDREYEEQHRDPSRPFYQLVAQHNSQIAGYGNCGIGFGGSNTYGFWVIVDENYLGRGIGRSLAAVLQDCARCQGQTRLRAGWREDMPRAAQFLAAAGFKQIGKRFESELCLDAFDEVPVVPVFERIAAAGITLSTFDQETAPDAMERLYQLAHELLLHVPFPGGAVFDIPFEDWKRETFEHPSATPEATVVAKRGDQVIGYSSVWLPKNGVPKTIMTGVAPPNDAMVSRLRSS